EVLVYEELQHHPHSNIVKYLGCLVDNGRIVGICLAKYDKTLSDVIHDQQGDIDTENIINGIRSGVDHLHHLGYIHGDLHRDNIMFSEGDNTPIIIDFHCC
ncbi:hypothetical protein FPQ18DRAFT_232788, partial [Pyronema domesticum]